MAFRGRGGGGGRWRGRGYGGRGDGFGYAKQEPYDLFPENVELPDIKGVIEEKSLVAENYRLQNFWIASPFYLEDNTSKRPQSKGMDIERFSDRAKTKNSLKRDNLGQILQLTPQNFPQELIEGLQGKQKSRKKVRWNPESGLEKLDMLEKLEQKHQGEDEKDGGKKKGENEEEEEEEDEDVEDEEAQEDFSDDDYYQNEHFDDDEDDYNAVDEGEDGPMY